MPDTVVGEFEQPEALCGAVRELRERGVGHIDAFTPYAVEELDELLALPPSRLPRYVLAGGLLGAGGAYFLQWYLNAYDYPIDVGGRPPHMPPAFLPITFEMGVLAAGITAFLCAFALSGLPHLAHAMFRVPGFARASVDRFWVALDVTGSELDARAARELLTRAGAANVLELRGDGA